MINGRHVRQGPAVRLAAAGALVVVAGGLLVLGYPAPASAASVVPTADSFVDVNKPTTNYGTKSFLKSGVSPGTQVSYLKFDLSGATDFSSAVLRVLSQSSTSNATGLEVRAVADNAWTERGITFDNKPAPGAVLDTSGPVTSGVWYDLDVSSVVTSNGTYSFAITSPAGVIKIASRESSSKPQLLVPVPPPPPPPPSPTTSATASPSPSPSASPSASPTGSPSASPTSSPASEQFVINALGGGSYEAVPNFSGTTYTGRVKSVVESAVRDLQADGDGGTVRFSAGTFDMGTEFLKLENIADITFQGAGMDATILRNSTDAAADTEPFNFSSGLRITIRDLQIIAGGAPRTTSDAIDGDALNSSLIERVKITSSRGRGIVLDGKDITSSGPRTAENNVIKGCVISGVPSHGIELLAARNNRVEGCTITAPGRAGIQANKSSSSADQPHKKANSNQLLSNTITGAGESGIAINSSDNNLISGNVVSNSIRDGIRIFTGSDGITAVGNRVQNNTATDTQSTKTQVYGLHITTSLCQQTVVGPGNNFSGNKTAPIRDLGSGTIYQ